MSGKRCDQQRLLLSHIHHAYQIGGTVTAFIRAFRCFPLAVLHRAERAFSSQAHRGDIRDRQSYFTAIVRRFNDEYQTEQAVKQRQQQTMQELDRQAEQRTAQMQRWADNPREHLESALMALAAQWNPSSESLLFDGAGLGRAWLDDALGRLAEMHGIAATQDIAAGTFDGFARQQADHLGPAGITVIEDVLHEHLNRLATARATVDCADLFAGDILRETGPPTRPDPSSPLRT